jgi:hypothetical protein
VRTKRFLIRYEIPIPTKLHPLNITWYEDIEAGESGPDSPRARNVSSTSDRERLLVAWTVGGEANDGTCRRVHARIGVQRQLHMAVAIV